MNWTFLEHNIIDATPRECGFCSTQYSKIFHAMPCNSEKAQIYRFSQLNSEEQRQEIFKRLLGHKEPL